MDLLPLPGRLWALPGLQTCPDGTCHILAGPRTQSQLGPPPAGQGLPCLHSRDPSVSAGAARSQSS